MGLYEKDFDFGLELSKARLKVIALIVIFLVAVVAILFIASAFFQPRAIAASLNDNPLYLKEKKLTILNVTISNVTAETARNVEIRVEAEDQQAIIVNTGSMAIEKIDLIESGLNRKTSFTVVPREGIKEGDYRIKVSVAINGTPFTESVVLKVVPD